MRGSNCIILEALFYTNQAFLNYVGCNAKEDGVADTHYSEFFSDGGFILLLHLGHIPLPSHFVFL